MKQKTKEWLHVLLWLADTFSRPTFRNLTDSFEGWASRQDLLRQLRRFEREQYLESQSDALGRRIYRLTENGRLTALGGNDPELRWKRHWDGRWRLVIFDIPESKNKLRVRLRRSLQEQHFGYLQNSVWITPDPIDEFSVTFSGAAHNVESLILMEGLPCSGEPNAAIVAGAWDFERLNRLYRDYLGVLDKLAALNAEVETAPQRFQPLCVKERTIWFEIVTLDPLLPEALLSPDYLGKKAWHARRQLAKALAHRVVRW
jgi:phenylacetic acid degradation operon negative regulatory protein